MSEKDMPVLTLDAFAEAEAENPLAKSAATDDAASILPEAPLSEREMAAVNEFANKINIYNSAEIINYGSAAQTKMRSFSENALEKVRTKDMDEIGGMLVSLVGELRGVSDTEKKGGGLFGMFKKAGDSVAQMKANYATVEKNVDKIVESLDKHKLSLMKDIAVMDQLYEKNLAYYKELTMYILAGKVKLEQLKTTELPELLRKAEMSGEQTDAQAAKNLSEMCDRFEKKIYDLELTRTITIQMAPQIRMVQNADSTMVDKIHSSIVNTIPLWKNQLVISLGLAHTRSAMEAQRRVSDTTNELLKKNADLLKAGTVEAAKESERGIVDIETLRYTNESLISTLDEVLEIQRDGKQKRIAAEKELREIEGTLKEKLLEISRNT
ncbi:MAG: toxic anion resistance protein [Clostridiales Family XIII bacterium]|jgi:uncharacterized protein YaaN involved in tellurite resistance|nr:toxic anion resistance protein [Clostridiales Family XIII bacterium]